MSILHRDKEDVWHLNVFQLYVAKRWKESVGYKLIEMVETDIVFEHKRRNDSDGRRSHCYETLYWNNGEPAYEIVKRPGITKIGGLEKIRFVVHPEYEIYLNHKSYHSFQILNK